MILLNFFQSFFKEYGIEVEVDEIPKTGEKFLSLTLSLKIAKEVDQKKSGGVKVVKDLILNIHVRDSFSFLGASLEKVISTFPVEKLKNLRLEFPKDEDFEVVRKKLPFPYGYMNDESKFSKSLPDMLTQKLMSDEDCNRL